MHGTRGFNTVGPPGLSRVDSGRARDAWSIFNTLTQDADYGMSETLLPEYAPALRGCVWALVAALLRLRPGADICQRGG